MSTQVRSSYQSLQEYLNINEEWESILKQIRELEVTRDKLAIQRETKLKVLTDMCGKSIKERYFQFAGNELYKVTEYEVCKIEPEREE